MSGHSKFGGSSTKRYINCPGSVRLIDAIKHESGDKEYNVKGDLFHKIVADSFLYYASFSFDALNGRTIRHKGFDVKIDSDIVDALRIAHLIPYQDVLKDRAYTGSRTMKDLINNRVIVVEERYNLTSIDPEAWGTPDVNYILGSRLRIVDYKFGSGVWVDEVFNTQLMFYALGVIENRPEAKDVKEVEFIIYQPFYHDETAEKIRRFVVPIDVLMEFKEQLKTAIEESKSSGAKFKKGDHCQFCPVVANCPAHQEEVKAIVPYIASSNPLSLPDITELPIPFIKNVLDKADGVIKWIKAIQATACAKAQGGVEIEGYKLVDSFGNRTWIDPELAEETVLMAVGEDADIYEPRKLKSPAQLEKIKELKTLVPSMTEKPFKGTVLVPSTDKKETTKTKPFFDKYEE